MNDKWTGTNPIDDIANAAIRIKDSFAASLEDKSAMGKVFCASTNDITSGPNSNEYPQVYILNPVDSGKLMKIYYITCGTNVSTNNNIFRLYKNPTISSVGTELTSVNLNFASENVSVCKVYKVPTVSANGTLFMNVISGATTMNQVNFSQKLILSPGNKILINVRPNTSNVTFSINVFWIEEV